MEHLAEMPKKVQVARIVATVLVIGVFPGAGAYMWRPLGLFPEPPGSTMVAEAGASQDFHTVVVEPRPVRETLSLSDRLAPWRTVTVAAPVESHVSAIHFQFGQKVEEGDLLLELNTADAVQNYREAKVAYIEKLRAFEAVRDWNNGPEWRTPAGRSRARAWRWRRKRGG